MRPASLIVLVHWLGCVVWAAPADALTIQFDYGYDGGFFTTAPQADAARAALEYAERNFEMFRDNLAAVEPSGPNEWKAYFTSPADGSEVEVVNAVLPAETVVIYAGGRELGDQVLGIGEAGGRWAQGTTEAWLNTVFYRGQAGAIPPEPTDFGPWGGSIVFDSSASWNFDVHNGPSAPEENDFLSTALHELCHVLGFATSDSWRTHVVSGSHEFVGPYSVAAFGGNVPLALGDGHWQAGTESTVGGAVQEAAMAPNLLVGDRKRLTVLDLAGMRDVGWDMPLPGDADHDGDIDSEDYLSLKAHLGGPGSWVDGDFDFDGDVDGDDLAAMQESFAESGGAPPAGLPSSAVPTPSAVTILLPGAAALIRRRRRGAGN